MEIYRPQRNYGCRIHDQYTYFGMRTVVLENELVRISILADKGTDIFEYVYKPRDLDFMWLTENGVQNPNRYLSTSSDPIATFVDYYPGGWQEVFPNGGPASVYMGAQFGQHGEVAQMPWDYEIIEDTPERISVRFSVRTKKMPFCLNKTLSLIQSSAALSIEEELQNLSEVPLPYMWGHHMAFGKPFLDENCRIIMPEGLQVLTEAPDSASARAGRVKRGSVYEWPYAVGANGQVVDLSVTPERGTASDIVYITGFKEEAWYLLENRSLGMGMKVEWDGEQLPCLWYWQAFGEPKGYPWYGRHYNVGLEPFCGYPAHGIKEAVRNQSAGRIGPKEVKRFRMNISPYVIMIG